MQGRHEDEQGRSSNRDAQPEPPRRGGDAGPRSQGLSQPKGRAELSGASAAFADRLRAEIGAEAFERYIGRTASLTLNGDGLVVTVSSRFAADLIRDRFGAAMRRAMDAGRSGTDADAAHEDGLPAIRFDIRPGDIRPGRAAQSAEAAEPPPNDRPHRPLRRGPGDDQRAARRAPREADGRTLDAYVVGASNRMAFEAARRIAEDESPDVTCPLFVYGPCGVGKSHLLAAVARRFGERFPGARVKVVSAEAFTNEYVRSVRANKVDGFHRAYRRIDLLCIDDVHFLSNKNGTQQELLHTFDTLDLGGARVVLASDNHPRHIKQFSGALVSRFVSGSLVRIESPDAETRRRMIGVFAARAGLRLAPGVAEMLSAGLGTADAHDAPSVRDLLGLVNRLAAHVRLVTPGADGLLDAAVASAVLRGADPSPASTDAGRPARPVPVDAILDTVCRTLAVTRADLAGRGRQAAVVLSRSLVVWLSRRLTRKSYPEIAEAMGGKNHSTAIGAYRRIEQQIASEARVAVGSHYDGMLISTLAERLERDLRTGS